MYPWIPWEIVADPIGSAEHTLGTTALTRCLVELPVRIVYFYRFICEPPDGTSYVTGRHSKQYILIPYNE